jgi:hypothetical protein
MVDRLIPINLCCVENKHINYKEYIMHDLVLFELLFLLHSVTKPTHTPVTKSLMPYYIFITGGSLTWIILLLY